MVGFPGQNLAIGQNKKGRYGYQQCELSIFLQDHEMRTTSLYRELSVMATCSELAANSFAGGAPPMVGDGCNTLACREMRPFPPHIP